MRIMNRKVFGYCLLAGLSLPISVSGVDFGPSLQPFFDQHCYECHDDVTAKGNLDLYSLETDLNDPGLMARWVRIYDRVANGEMPPKDEPRPSPGEMAAFSRALGQPLIAAHSAEKGTVLRRLNRQEYENTLNDLFGTNLRLASLLPEDGRSHEFDNVGEALNISMVQMQRYLEAIEMVIDEAKVHEIAKPESTVRQFNYGEAADVQKFFENQWLKLDDQTAVFFKDTGYPSGTLKDANIRGAGYYTVRITGFAYQSDEPVTFAVNGDTFLRGAERPNFGYFSFPPGKPTTVEFTTWIEDRYMIQIKPCGITDMNYELKRVGPKDYEGPGLAIQQIEIEGPLIEEYPGRGHRLLFDGLNRQEIMPSNPSSRQKTYYVPQFEIPTEHPIVDATPVLKRVATAAFRRPVTDSDLAPYLRLLEEELALESSFEEALLTAVKAIFCSPEFLFLKEPPGELNDYALASRLSYAFIRTAPDQELLDLAAKGRLSTDSKVMVAQMNRLLADPRSDRFINDYTDAWLNLRDMDFTSPDNKLFPEFDSYLKHSMVAESQAYLRELINRNAPASSIVKSRFAMINERLAEHYGISSVKGPDIRPVSLPEDSARGGFLSQGSVLKVSANGTNTSPVVRGVWVMERILGVTPPPPPPGIPGVEPDIRGASTLRELLDKHRDSVSCQACHEKIDPPGFALESFNPVGGWRENFRSLGEGEKVEDLVHGVRVRYRVGPGVDSSGVLSDGREFSGYREFRDLLAAEDQVLARAFTEKMLTFLTGREMGFSDREEIGRIVAQAASSQYGIRDLLGAAVTSEIFLNK